MCCLVGAFSRPKTDLVRRRHACLHTILAGAWQVATHAVQLTHTLHIQLTHTLQLAFASAAALSARAGDGGSCHMFTYNAALYMFTYNTAHTHA